MAYVNCGVMKDGARIATKSNLKEQVKSNPDNVILDSTAMFGDQFNGRLTDAPTEHTYQVVGPDPYTKRNWYASIKNVNGTWKVS